MMGGYKPRIFFKMTMLEKPDLEDGKILTYLRASYGMAAVEIEFLPIGNDATAWVYKVHTDFRTSYFLKVKKGIVSKPAVVIPRYLKDNGIEQVVAPLLTRSQDLWTTIDDFSLTLYPFIEGSTGMQIGLSDSQWIEFGAVVKQNHATKLPSDILAQVQHETFVPQY